MIFQDIPSSDLYKKHFNVLSLNIKTVKMSSWFASGHHNQDGVVWSVLGEDIRMMCSISNLGNRGVSGDPPTLLPLLKPQARPVPHLSIYGGDF